MKGFHKDLNIADIVPRMGAAAIDAVILGALFIGMNLLLITFSSHLNFSYTSHSLLGVKQSVFALSINNLTWALLYGALIFIGLWLYFVPLETSKWQASIGKKLVGLKVVSDNGEKMGQGQATLRCFIKFITLMAPTWVLTTASLILVVSNPLRRAFHDFVAGTVVIEDHSQYDYKTTKEPPRGEREYRLEDFPSYDKY